jgi:TonB family protein
MSGKEQTLIQFTVAADGQILKPQISRTSGNKSLDDEAMRLVMLMPNWKPGIQKGIAVPVITTLSISFNGNEGC